MKRLMKGTNNQLSSAVPFDLSALIDVLFVLLIFFVAIAPRHVDIKAMSFEQYICHPPKKASHHKIHIDGNQGIKINGQAILLNEVDRMLSLMKAQGQGKPIELYANKETTTEVLVTVLDVIRRHDLYLSHTTVW